MGNTRKGKVPRCYNGVPEPWGKRVIKASVCTADVRLFYGLDSKPIKVKENLYIIFDGFWMRPMDIEGS